MLSEERLDSHYISDSCDMATVIARVNNGCAVVTDASSDHCYVYSGSFGILIGYDDRCPSSFESDSSDEDEIYERIHPEDLVDKRLLEYEFFKSVDKVPVADKLNYIARCRIRMKNCIGEYILVDNTTQLIALSPAGKIWLILCTYSLSSDSTSPDDIMPSIINTRSGEISYLSFSNRRQHILSKREKEVLNLIREGKLSKQIAAILGISINTVNRHRQNILEKLSVANSVEAVAAATLMKLL